MVRRILHIYRQAYLGLPTEIWMLATALFVNRFGTMVLPFFTLYLTSQQGYSEAAAGRMLSVYGIGAIAGAYVAGRLTMPLGANRVQIICLLCAVPFFLLIPLFQSTAAVAVTVFLLSFFAEGVRPANSTAIAQFAPPEVQMKAFGLQRMALNLGVSFGPAIGGFLATISFVWLFVADAATTLLCALTLWWFFGFARRRRVSNRDTTSSSATKASRSEAASPLRDSCFVVFSCLTMLSAVVFFQINVTYPLYLRSHYGLSKPWIGMIYAVNTLTIVAVEMVLLNYFRRYPQIPLIACGVLCSCVGLGILPLGSSLGFCVFSMLVITIGEMLWMPAATGWVASRSRRGDAGMYMGWHSISYSLAVIIAPALGGVIYQHHRDLLWYGCIGLGVVVFAAFHVLHLWLERGMRSEEQLHFS